MFDERSRRRIAKAVSGYEASRRSTGMRRRLWPVPQSLSSGCSLVVTVTNDGSDDWDYLTPVRVHGVDEDYAANPPPPSIANMTFSGTRLDDYEINSGTQSDQIGITQEAIPQGGSGRVCIRGATLALIWDFNKDLPTGFEYSPWDYAHVEKKEGRWLLRNGCAGDARIITLCQGDDSQYYQDGTYNDQVLAIVDLQPPPDRVMGVTMFDDQTSKYAITVVVQGGNTWLYNNTQNIVGNLGIIPTLCEMCVLPGWDIPKDTATIPVRRIVPGGMYCAVMSDLDSLLRSEYTYGMADGKLWAGLCGFKPVTQHYLDTDSARYSSPFFGWFQFTGMPETLCFHFTNSTAYVQDQFGNDFDGDTHRGVEYPICGASLQPTQVQGAGGTSGGWNLQRLGNTDGVFFGTGLAGRYDTVDDIHVLPLDCYMDDQANTIKALKGSMVPPGWRTCDGTHGTPDLTDNELGLNFIMRTDD